MGLFDFVRDAGERLFGGGNDEDDIKKMNMLNQLAGDLDLTPSGGGITFDDGVATITGTMPSQADKERLVLLIGNTQGVGQVNDMTTVEKPEPESKMYTVKSGDSLSKIAKEFYGDPMKYPTIFDANKPMLKDPERIYPGQVLRIPSEMA